MDNQIMENLTNSTTCKLDNEKDLKKPRPASLVALISGANEVFNLFEGKVEFVGEYEGLQSVCILVNDQEMIRYRNLIEVVDYVLLGRELGSQIRLGTIGKMRPLGFEYCTQWRGNSNYPVRANGRTYYKQNPLDILDGKYVPPAPVKVIETYTNNKDDYIFSDEQEEEWIGEIFVDEATAIAQAIEEDNQREKARLMYPETG